MAAIEDVETLRERLLLLAKTSPPPPRQKKGSKAAALRALYPDLIAIQKQIPHASYADLTRMLKEIGLDVSPDSVRRIMQGEMAGKRSTIVRGKKAEKRAVKPPKKPVVKAEEKADVQSETEAAVQSPAASVSKPAQSYTPDQMQHAGIRRRDKRV